MLGFGCSYETLLISLDFGFIYMKSPLAAEHFRLGDWKIYVELLIFLCYDTFIILSTPVRFKLQGVMYIVYICGGSYDF